MSIASRITAIEGHIEDAYTEISRLGVDLTNVDKNIDNIADKLQDVYADLPKVTGEGSSLSLTPTRKGGLSIIPKGACEQDSTTGTQLLRLVDGTYTDTGNEITAVVSNGKITLNGTSTATRFVAIPTNSNYSSIAVGDNFTVSTNNSVANSSIIFRVGTNNEYDTTLDEINKTNTLTLVENKAIQSIIKVRISSGTTLTNFVLQPQLEKGDTATSWNKYTGGIPSPNPDFPQDIRVATGDNSFLVSNNTNFTLENGGITGNDGQPASAGTRVRTSNFIDIDSNATKIYLSCKNAELYRGRIYCYDANNTYLGNTDGLETLPRSVSIANGTKKIKVAFGYLTNTSITYNDIENVIISDLQQTYTLHLGTEYLAGIGDYDDEIEGKTDDWKIRRYVGKKIITSNDVSLAKDTLTNLIYYRFSKETNDISNGNYQFHNLFYSNAKVLEAGAEDLASNIGTISSRRGNTTYWVGFPLGTTLQQAQDKLNNSVLYYQLKEATEIPITDTTLITDLNNMYQAMGYDGTTNITITSDSNNAQMTASVSALKGE